jgi:hypothetical protein
MPLSLDECYKQFTTIFSGNTSFEVENRKTKRKKPFKEGISIYLRKTTMSSPWSRWQSLTATNKEYTVHSSRRKRPFFQSTLLSRFPHPSPKVETFKSPGPPKTWGRLQLIESITNQVNKGFVPTPSPTTTYNYCTRSATFGIWYYLLLT